MFIIFCISLSWTMLASWNLFKWIRVKPAWHYKCRIGHLLVGNCDFCCWTRTGLVKLQIMQIVLYLWNWIYTLLLHMCTWVPSCAHKSFCTEVTLLKFWSEKGKHSSENSDVLSTDTETWGESKKLLNQFPKSSNWFLRMTHSRSLQVAHGQNMQMYSSST